MHGRDRTRVALHACHIRAALKGVEFNRPNRNTTPVGQRHLLLGKEEHSSLLQ